MVVLVLKFSSTDFFLTIGINGNGKAVTGTGLLILSFNIDGDLTNGLDGILLTTVETNDELAKELFGAIIGVVID